MQAVLAEFPYDAQLYTRAPSTKERGEIRKKRESAKETTYNNLDIRVRRPHRGKHLVISANNLRHSLATVHVVGAQHEIDNVGDGLLDPAIDVLVGDVDGLPARVTLVAGVEVGGLGAAVLRVVGHGANEVDFVGETLGREHVPHEGAPAGDFGDGVTEGDWGPSC